MAPTGIDRSDAGWTDSAAVESQVEMVLRQMTLDEKVNLVSGRLVLDDAGNVPAMPAGIPPLYLADGPAGVRIANPAVNERKATALPAPIALAATWDPELARRYGAVLGAEVAATGHNILLGPAVDIARAPRGGRTFESFGEDPFLQARLVVPEVEAIQEHAVAACIKHFIANNQEYLRTKVDVHVDERTLQELYLPPMAAAVREGRVASAMGSYNQINGVYACENPHTLTEILRDQWGFRGFVMSDFLATQSTANSAKAGLDWELGTKMWGPRLLQAVQAGEVSLEVLDTMVRRILRPIIGLGLADRPLQVRPLPVQQHGAEARTIAERGMVLLKNTDEFLPLDSSAIRSIAVIGPEADNVSAAGGGSGCVQPTYAVSVLDGIRQRAGAGVRVAYAPGTDPIGAGVLLPGFPAVPSACLTPADSEQNEHGLLVEYWTNTAFKGKPKAVRVEPRAEVNYGFFDLFPGLNVTSPKLPARPEGASGSLSIRWSGRLIAPASGDYLLSLTCLGTARLYLDSELLIDSATAAPAAKTGDPFLGSVACAASVYYAAVTLKAGSSYPLTIEYVADATGQWFFNEAMLRLGWRPPQQAINPTLAKAVELAQQCDVAVVVVRTYETEEMDRPNLRLPNEQDELIRAVAAANPATVVVLMNAGPVEMASWEAGVAAVVEAWYAGQEQGNAVARVLFGDVNPGGRLPLTFPRDETQTPVATPAQYPGIDGVVEYSEGLFIGYRGYERLGLAPQYPFGYGLSYTTFAYDNLRLSSNLLGAGQAIVVQVDVTNTGQRAGDDVVQMYVSHLNSAVDRPPQELKGFKRVSLQPGETQTVSLSLAGNDLAYWEVAGRRFMVENGKIQIRIGRSSAEIVLEAGVDVVS